MTYNPERLCIEVCYQYGVRLHVLLGKGRTKPLAFTRQTLMWLLRHHSHAESATYIAIAKLLGGRDHGTIIHGVRKVQKALDAGDMATRKLQLDIARILSRCHTDATVAALQAAGPAGIERLQTLVNQVNAEFDTIKANLH